MGKWPFKHLKQNSEWPLQGLVCAMAASVLQLPPEFHKDATRKTIERAFRVAARLCREFEVNPVYAMKMAEAQLCREIPGAKAQIGAATADAAEATADDASAIVANLFGNLTPKGEA